MSYQGARARPEATETRRVFAVSKVRLAADGHIAELAWAEVDPKINRSVGAEMQRSLAEAVDALHAGAQVVALFKHAGRALPERPFVVLEHADGRTTLALDGLPSAGREIGDIAKFDGVPAATPSAKAAKVAKTAKAAPAASALPPAAPARRSTAALKPASKPASKSKPKAQKPVFAVSRVRLDPDGRVTAVMWGRVDTQANTWATPEALAPVDDVVHAIQAGDPVYALFPTPHGHMPERRFGVVDYDDGWQTIVLDGPALPEREIHDMDRVAA